MLAIWWIKSVANNQVRAMRGDYLPRIPLPLLPSFALAVNLKLEPGGNRCHFSRTQDTTLTPYRKRERSRRRRRNKEEAGPWLISGPGLRPRARTACSTEGLDTYKYRDHFFASIDKIGDRFNWESVVIISPILQSEP